MLSPDRCVRSSGPPARAGIRNRLEGPSHMRRKTNIKTLWFGALQSYTADCTSNRTLGRRPRPIGPAWPRRPGLRTRSPAGRRDPRSCSGKGEIGRASRPPPMRRRRSSERPRPRPGAPSAKRAALRRPFGSFSDRPALRTAGCRASPRWSRGPSSSRCRRSRPGCP
jgi:hypothetical protein